MFRRLVGLFSSVSVADGSKSALPDSDGRQTFDIYNSRSESECSVVSERGPQIEPPDPNTSGSGSVSTSASTDIFNPSRPRGSPRQRKRKPPPKDAYAGGTTYQHGSDGEPPVLPPVSKSSKLDSRPTYLDSFTLISCADFGGGEQKCPYRVVLESTAAVIMDIHAHLCKTEVIGLLGGRYEGGDGSLRVVRAEPCSSKSTSIHCDMDPVSQTEAGERIQRCGLQVVGWYHSHPTFVPDPSQQDIESQKVFQKWFSQGGDHFLGVIVSPYNTLNKTPNSEIRCFTTVTRCGSNHAHSKPYKFDYKIETSVSNGELCDLVPNVARLLDMYRKYQHTVDLLDGYRSSSELTALDKMLISVEGYLQTTDSSQVDIKLLLHDLRFILTNYCEKSD